MGECDQVTGVVTPPVAVVLSLLAEADEQGNAEIRECLQLDADDFHGSLSGRVSSSVSSDHSMKGSSLMILRASSAPL